VLEFAKADAAYVPTENKYVMACPECRHYISIPQGGLVTAERFEKLTNLGDKPKG